MLYIYIHARAHACIPTHLRTDMHTCKQANACAYIHTHCITWTYIALRCIESHSLRLPDIALICATNCITFRCIRTQQTDFHLISSASITSCCSTCIHAPDWKQHVYTCLHKSTQAMCTRNMPTHVVMCKRTRKRTAATASNTSCPSSPTATTLHGKAQCFAPGLPPQNNPHATFMRPLQCVLQHPLQCNLRPRAAEEEPIRAPYMHIIHMCMHGCMPR